MPVRRQQSHPADKWRNRESLRVADGRRVVVAAVHKHAPPCQASFCSDFFTRPRHWAEFFAAADVKTPFFSMEKYEE